MPRRPGPFSRRAALAALLTVTTLAALAAPVAAQLQAGECPVPPGLGATLLFPYFEVDLSDPNGVNTVLSVNNGVSVPTLTRLVVWTDWGVPTLAFDIYLEAFDVQTLSVRSLFDGSVPSTGAGQDLSAFEFCNTFPPDHTNPILTSQEVGQLRADHTGVVGP
ncbi:MAG: hypothetical protein AAGF23_27385, partial [Acidobacteriota bacterium]